jgi:replicative DNA helicase
MAEIAGAPLYINDTGMLPVQALCDEPSRLVRNHGVMLIAVDYLQLITPGLRGETREREVSEIVRRLKALALDLAVPVVVAAQFNRDPAGGQEAAPRRPTRVRCHRASGRLTTERGGWQGRHRRSSAGMREFRQ